MFSSTFHEIYVISCSKIWQAKPHEEWGIFTQNQWHNSRRAKSIDPNNKLVEIIVVSEVNNICRDKLLSRYKLYGSCTNRSNVSVFKKNCQLQENIIDKEYRFLKLFVNVWNRKTIDIALSNGEEHGEGGISATKLVIWL